MMDFSSAVVFLSCTHVGCGNPAWIAGIFYLAGMKGLPILYSGAEVFSKPQAVNLPGLFQI